MATIETRFAAYIASLQLSGDYREQLLEADRSRRPAHGDAEVRWRATKRGVKSSAILLPARPRGVSPVPYSILAVFWPSVVFFAPCFALFWLILAHLHRIFPYSGPIDAIPQRSKLAKIARYWPYVSEQSARAIEGSWSELHEQGVRQPTGDDQPHQSPSPAVQSCLRCPQPVHKGVAECAQFAE
jgi:hypothetical protein